MESRDNLREQETLLSGPHETTLEKLSSRIRRKPVLSTYTDIDNAVSPKQAVIQREKEWRPTQPPSHQSLSTESPEGIVSRPPKHRSPLVWWSLEILSLLAAVACLCTIIAVLLYYDEKPLSSWISTIITLNGLIALLSTLHRTFLMVSVSSVLAQAKWDQLAARNSDSGSDLRLGNFALFEYASQGLTGSFQLLWRFKGGHTACIGAFLTISSLVFGFFSQQLIDTRVASVESQSSTIASNVPRATFKGTVSGSTIVIKTSADISHGTKMSMLNGFASNTTVDPIQLNCANANCTWPIIPTLGVCGACVNLTDTIEIKDGYMPHFEEDMPCVPTAKGGTEIQLCQDSQEVFAIRNGTGQVFLSGKAPIERNSSLLIGEFAAIAAYRQGYTGWGGTIANASAAECAFWYCVQAHNVSVQSGVVQDDIVDTWTEHHYNTTTESVTRFTDIPESFNANSEEVYGVGPNWMDSLRNHWDENVHGNVTFTFGKKQLSATSYYTEGLMYSFHDFDTWAERFAHRMTNDLRETGVAVKVVQSGEYVELQTYDKIPQREQYNVIASVTQVIITVRWGWIAYPAAVLLVAAAYLAIELVRSAGQKSVRPWRNDPLVTLFMSVDKELKDKIRPGLEHPMGVSHVAGDSRMGVIRDEDGLPLGFHAKAD